MHPNRPIENWSESLLRHILRLQSPTFGSRPGTVPLRAAAVAMISKTTLARSAQISSRHLRQAGASQTRTFASPAISGSYDTTEVNGVKVAARNSHGPTTKLAVVAKAGTRYQPLPGLATGLETFAFKVTIGSASREVGGTR
jgi:hypothetical protein